MVTEIKNLVFEGGGVKGVAYAGAIEVLDQEGFLSEAKKTAGTSAGAITACLVSLNLSSDKIGEIVKSMDLSSFQDRQSWFRRMRRYGLHPGKTFLTWIKEQIEGAGLGATATFEDFRQAGCKDLHVYASDIFSHQVREFSVHKTPTVIVAEAVRASMSIPIFFDAWQFSNNNPDDHFYVDGGMVYNYPITAFDLGGVTNWNTLGFRLEDTHEKHEPTRFRYGQWRHYAKNTFATLMQTQNIDFKKDPEQVKRSVIINDEGVSATDFEISEQKKNELVENGRKAAKAWFEQWKQLK